MRVVSCEFGPALEEAELLALTHPLTVQLQAIIDTDNTQTGHAPVTLVLLLKSGSNLVRAYCRLILAFAAPTICANTSCSLCHLDEVVILVMAGTGGHAETAIVHILAHLALLTTSQT